MEVANGWILYSGGRSLCCLYNNKNKVDHNLWVFIIYAEVEVELAGGGCVINGATLSSFSVFMALVNSSLPLYYLT